MSELSDRITKDNARLREVINTERQQASERDVQLNAKLDAAAKQIEDLKAQIAAGTGGGETSQEVTDAVTALETTIEDASGIIEDTPTPEPLPEPPAA